LPEHRFHGLAAQPVKFSAPLGQELTLHLVTGTHVPGHCCAPEVILLEPASDAAPSTLLNDLKDLRFAHQALAKVRTAAKNRSKHMRSGLLKRQNAIRTKP
jgi:hypothetical protein